VILSGILDRSSSVPLHEQLAHGIRSAILAGRLAGGEALPSTRSLAADVGVARGTVVAAYEILAGEGSVLARPGGRTVVALIPRASPPLAAPSPAVVATPGVLDLRPGRPRTTGLADAAWRSAWRRASAVDPDADVADAAGVRSLRTEIARHLGRTRGLDVSADDVVVTAGTSDAMLLTLLSLGPREGRGRLRVGVEDPGYPRVRTLLGRLGIEAVPVPVRLGSGLDLGALEKLDGLDALIVTPHHHYPLGSRLDAEDRARLLAWAARTDAVIIEDDYDSEFPHGRAPLPPLYLLDPSRIVLIGSLSKLLTPALRCGWIVATGAVGERIRAARDDLDLPVSLVQQEALALYLGEGALARHTARRRREYRHRRRLLLEAFAGVPGVELVATDGGLHAVALLRGSGRGVDGGGVVGHDDVSREIDGRKVDGRELERAVVADLLARGIRVAPLSGYAVGANDPEGQGRRALRVGEAPACGDEPGSLPFAGLPAGIVFGYAEPSTVALMEAVNAMIAVMQARA